MSTESEPIGAEVFSERVEARMAELRSMLGAITIAADDRERLLELSDEVKTLAGEIRDVAEQDVAQEVFGGEESYWIGFRMLCAGKNAGQPMTLDKIWSHFARNCDMSGEDMESVRTALIEWAGDIAEDAYDKLKLRGKLVELPDGFCFALYESVSKSEPGVEPKKAAKTVPAKKGEHKEKVPTAQEVAEACRELVMTLLLEESPRKQSAVRRQLSVIHGVSQKESLDLVTSMVEDGKIVKAKPVGSQSALLALRAEELETNRPTEVSSPEAGTDLERKQVDVQLGSQILSVLANERQHLRKMEASEIWQRIHTAAHRKPDKQSLDKIRKTARQLARYELLEVGEEKKGTKVGEFGVKRLSQRGKKSKSMSVFKIRLASFEVKAEVKQVLESSTADLEKWLAEKLEAARIAQRESPES